MIYHCGNLFDTILLGCVPIFTNVFVTKYQSSNAIFSHIPSFSVNKIKAKVYTKPDYFPDYIPPTQGF